MSQRLAQDSALDRPPAPAVVWLKRDLRLEDHGPLSAALATGRPVLLVFLIEPEVLAQAEFSPDHWEFQAACLRELRGEVERRGGVFLTRRGEAVEQLEALRRETGFTRLFAHEETGTWTTYQRDRRVRRWARETGVEFREFPQTGVVRRLKSRDGWNREWSRRMDGAVIEAPESLAPPACGGLGAAEVARRLRGLAGLEDLPGATDLGLGQARQRVQGAGGAAARAVLEDFLDRRGWQYSGNISSPVTAADCCSRLSAALAFGLLSMRQVWQASEARRRAVMALPPQERGRWPASLRSFQARLHWHCHFMQKLEDEPLLERRNLHRACDGLRDEAAPDALRLAAWKAGRTGHPLVDACIRSVVATGWLTFRMRAMVVSYASYDLWLHWRHTAPWLGRQFLDFEPGIHYSQFQMQSGTTGINTLRMYNPVKQAQDHDPRGEFIRRWVPELAGVPAPLVFTPWRMGQADQERFGVRIVPGGEGHSTGVVAGTYPCPLVDHGEAVKLARAAFGRIRGQAEARKEAREVARRHGSRRDPRGAMQQDPVRRALKQEEARPGDNRRRGRGARAAAVEVLCLPLDGEEPDGE